MKKTYKIQGIDIVIDESDPTVFQPHPITKLLAESISIKPGDEVLEIGSGSGLIAITAAKLGAKQVYASDISEAACRATATNAMLNNLNGELKVSEGDFFSPFTNRQFDVIISNPPCMPFPKGATYINEGLSLAVDGGEDGIDATLKLLSEIDLHLKPYGSFYLPIPKWSSFEHIIDIIKPQFNCELVNKGNVSYYLADYNEVFHQHIVKLNSLNRVSFISINGSFLAEIMIFKLKTKYQYGN